MRATKRARRHDRERQSAAADDKEEATQLAESQPSQQESHAVGVITEAGVVTEAPTDDPFADLVVYQERPQADQGEDQPLDRTKELEKKIHDLEQRNTRLIEELKHAISGGQSKRSKRKKTSTVAAAAAAQTSGTAKPKHRLYNKDNCGEEFYFLSVDLREANFQALRALGFIDPEWKSWRELIDKVLKPVDAVAALFYAKAFRMCCLRGFEDRQVKQKLKEMMREVRQAIGDSLGEPVEDDNCDEVVYKIEGEVQAKKCKRDVEQALAGLGDSISFRIELFRLSIDQHEGYSFFAKTNVETNQVQIKMLTPISTPEVTDAVPVHVA